MKKFLSFVLAAILACFCFACGNNDESQREEDGHKNVDCTMAIGSVYTLFSSSGKVYYNNDERVNGYHYDRENITISQGDIYYLCVTDFVDIVSASHMHHDRYINPAVFDENGELVSEPLVECDGEYIQIMTKSNWLQCMYMIKPLNKTEKTTITIPEHIADDMIYPEISLSFSIGIPE
ncbi:MAG: hypothetical protein K2O04_04430 [Clostridiales bacterium]|nr:hypothetical protein [Clostridiales bacterium]